MKDPYEPPLSCIEFGENEELYLVLGAIGTVLWSVAYVAAWAWLIVF